MKPILFNSEMVRAILDGRKTVTRRLVKPQPVLVGRLWQLNGAAWTDNLDSVIPVPCHSLYNEAPFHPGDVLYVRETWSFWPCYDCDNEMCYGGKGWYKDTDGCFVYKTQESKVPYEEKWHPSIHMPKEAARIFLRVKDVRAERLQAITMDQISAEGIDNTVPCNDSVELCNYCPLPDSSKGVHCYGGNVHMCEGSHCKEALDAWEEEFSEEFAGLWDSTIKKAALTSCGWDANPWVWVIEFEKCEKPKEDA